jgi:hypothetical protein
MTTAQWGEEQRKYKNIYAFPQIHHSVPSLRKPGDVGLKKIIFTIKKKI